MKGITVHRDGDGQVREVRYLTDDRDARDGRRLELCIGWGNNGDWYIVTVPEGERSPSAVRLCTSGGASSAVPGFVPLIAEAFRKLASAGDPIAPAEPPQPPRCPKCGYVMCQQFDSRPVNALADIAIPNGRYVCYYCTLLQLTGEQEK